MLRLFVALLVGALAAFSLTGCWPFTDPPPPTISVPPPPAVPTTAAPPSSSGSQPTAPRTQPGTQPPAPQPGAGQPATAYPLTQAQAIAVVSAGGWVAGRTHAGTEIVIHQDTTTSTEDEPVIENVCEPEYDPDQGRSVTKCHDKTVYRPKTTTTTVYVTTGALSSHSQNVYGAFANAGALGAMTFRRAP